MIKRRLELICKFADLESIGIYNLTTALSLIQMAKEIYLSTWKKYLERSSNHDYETFQSKIGQCVNCLLLGIQTT